MSLSRMQRGFYRMPAVHGERVVFICEDDLWEVPLSGGRAIRLTSSVAELSWPAFSPDGEHIALISKKEGNTDVYVMPSLGGPLRRLTFDHVAAHVIGWSEDGSSILFASQRQSAHRHMSLFAVPLAGGQPRSLDVGEGVWYDAVTSSEGTTQRIVGRHSIDLASWKRYRGGLAAQMWIDEPSSSGWLRLDEAIDAGGAGCVRPVFIEDRVYFTSDMGGHGNLYSCLVDGSELRQHTDHAGFYVRSMQTDRHTIVYDCGGDLYSFDPNGEGDARLIEVAFHSPRTQRSRKFVDAADYVESYALHPKGHYLNVVARGKPFTFGLWEGAVKQHGARQGVRYRLADFLHDGSALISTCDEGVETGSEYLVLHHLEGGRGGIERCLEALPEGERERLLGRIVEMRVSPKARKIAVGNHRNELLIVDLDAQRVDVIARSPRHPIEDFAWSPDGQWLAYVLPTHAQTSRLMLYELDTQTSHALTDGEFLESCPAFDPKGRYLYFVSYRSFDPIYGNLFFELGLQRGHNLCLITLDASARSPFIEVPRPFDQDSEAEDEEEGDEEEDGDGAQEGASTEEDVEQRESSQDESSEEKAPKEKRVKIDLDGIGQRVVQFPLGESIITQVEATRDRVYYLTLPLRGSLSASMEREGSESGVLRFWSFEGRKSRVFHRDVSGFTLSANGEALALWSDDQLRVLSASAAPPDDDDDAEDAGEEYDRKTGWIDLGRIALEVDPLPEWRQMLAEIWRLMRDDFWRADMSGVDWEEVYTRYAPLVDRVGSRKEFSAIVWAMQGELGTSHAYEFGGDYREGPSYWPGRLGAEFVWDASAKRCGEGNGEGAYRISKILHGDSWSRAGGSPLLSPGVGIEEGDLLLGIDGAPVDAAKSVDEHLLNKAGREVELEVCSPGDETSRRVVVKTVTSHQQLYYRDWVRTRRELVEELSDGKIGYVHVPDMGPEGYAEFHRGYASQHSKEGLIVDVRYNGGGHISQLILEKLRRKPLGFDLMRHGDPVAYPLDGPGGPVVALTNAYAGSDGDIFSHGFKVLGIGPLVGTRTWGGVIGIWPRHTLVDGSVTTQPAFSFWFRDVGFGLENHGAEPDIYVEETPSDQAEGDDVQLERAVEEALERLDRERAEYAQPESFAPYPNLAPPKKSR